jgi:hypothetical protein
MIPKTLDEIMLYLEKMEKRLKVVEDIEEIKKLHIYYVDMLMACNWSEVMDCFAENAGVDIGGGTIQAQGKEAIEKLFRGHIAKHHVGKEGDVLIHPIISVDGDRAKGSWLLYMMYYHPQTFQSMFWVQGYYNCEYIRENGKWKFSLFKFKTRIFPPGVPPTEEFLSNFLIKASKENKE